MLDLGTSTSVESQSLRVCLSAETYKAAAFSSPNHFKTETSGIRKVLISSPATMSDMRSREFERQKLPVLRSELGLIFLLFMIGLELNVEELGHLGQAACCIRSGPVRSPGGKKNLGCH